MTHFLIGFLLIGSLLIVLGLLAISLLVSRDPYRTRFILLKAAINRWLDDEDTII